MINCKPSRDFDAIFNTNLSQSYQFPFGLTSDQVYQIIHEADSGINIQLYNSIESNINFPYLDYNKLSNLKKREVILGMASEFNADDIVWFVEGKTGTSPESKKIEKEMINIFGWAFCHYNIQWVVSKKTWDRMQEQMAVEIRYLKAVKQNLFV